MCEAFLDVPHHHNSRAINAFLGLKPPRECHVAFRRKRSTRNFLTDDELQLILQEVGEEGTDFGRSKATGIPTRMDVVDLNPQ